MCAACVGAVTVISSKWIETASESCVSDAAMVAVCENCVAVVVVGWGYIAECTVVASYVGEDAADCGDVEYAVRLVPWYCAVDLGVGAVDDVPSDCVVDVDVAETK